MHHLARVRLGLGLGLGSGLGSGLGIRIGFGFGFGLGLGLGSGLERMSHRTQRHNAAVRRRVGVLVEQHEGGRRSQPLRAWGRHTRDIGEI